MADKPRNRRGSNDGERIVSSRGPATGRPAQRPGKPGRTAAPGGNRGGGRSGLDPRALERLEKEGLLTSEGRQMMAERTPGNRAGNRTAQAPAGRVAGKGRAPVSGREAGKGRAPVPGRVEGAGIAAPKPKLAVTRVARAKAAPSPDNRMTPAEATVAERLHKVMAQAGVASRRHSEELIQAGRVTVNGKVVTELGTKVVPGKDIVELDGRRLGKAEELVHIMLNKPKGVVTTLFDPQGRPKVTDLLGDDVAQRVYPVGRLDYDTEGLLLLTNDGELANALMHPAREVKKTYIAKVRGVPGPAKLRALAEGVELEDGMTAPADVKLIGAKGPNAATVSIRIHEGRNRQVRRMFEAVGHEVIHLVRTTVGPLALKELPVGQWRHLTEREIHELRGAAGLKLLPVTAAPEAGAAVTGKRPRGRQGATPQRAERQQPAARPRGAAEAQLAARPQRPARQQPRGQAEPPHDQFPRKALKAPGSRFSFGKNRAPK